MPFFGITLQCGLRLLAQRGGDCLRRLLVVALALVPAWAGAPHKVTLQLKWTHQFQFAGYYAAQAKGFYAAAGLDVTLVEAGPQRLPLPVVESGQAEFGVSDMEVFRAYLEGRPLVNLGVVFQHSPTVVLALRGSGIRRPSDLTGRTVMFQGGQGKVETRAMLASEGLRMDALREVPHSWNLDDLVSGRVDALSAYATNEPFLLNRRGVEVVELRPIDYGVDFYGDLLFSTRAFVQSHPEVAQAFRRASFQGWDYAMAHPEELVDYILTLPGVAERGITREKLQFEAALMRNLVLPGLVDLGHVNPGRLRRIAEVIQQQGFLKFQNDPEEFVYLPPEPTLHVWRRLLRDAAPVILTVVVVVGIWIIHLRYTVKARTLALKRQNDLFESLLKMLPVGVFMVEAPSGRPLVANEAACDLLGRGILPDASRSNLAEVYKAYRADNGEPYPPEAMPILRGMQGETSHVDDLIVERPDGTRTLLEIFGSPVRDSQGQIWASLVSFMDISQRKRAEAALRASREQFAKAFAISPDAINITRLSDGVYVAVNEGFTQITGYSSKEVVGHASTSAVCPLWVNPEDRARMVAGLREQGEVTGLEAPFRLKDGRIITGLMSAKILDIGGEPHVLSITRDITERKRLEQAQLFLAEAGWLATGEDFFNALARFLAEHLGVDYVCIDRLLGDALEAETLAIWFDGQFELNCAYALKDTPCGDVVGRRICHFPSGVRHQFPKDQVLQDMVAESYLGATLWGAQGQPIGLIALIGRRPMTEARLAESTLALVAVRAAGELERREAESALRARDEEYRRLVGDMQVGVLLQGPKAEILLSNPMALELLGLTEDQILGKTSFDPVWNVIHPDGSPYPGADHPVPQAIATRKPVRKAIMGVFRPTTGERIWLSVDAEPQLTADGTVRQVVCTFVDITNLKHAEEEKVRLQARLLQAQKMESLGSLAGGVAHDMNNVLGAILGLASASSHTLAPEEPARRAFETISKAAVRGGEMVKRLLRFAHQSPAEARELDLNAILREEMHLLEHTTLAKVHLVEDLAPNLWTIQGDVSALTHAVMNLCVNAVDAMSEGGTLTLRTRNGEDNSVEVVVEDNGCGMTRDVLDRALDPFFTTKEQGKGTGLGLSMVYSTVKAHHGELELESESGKGTRVRLRFPASPASAGNALVPSVSKVEPASQALHVLLVDDDELIRTSMEAVLEVLGHRVITASSGEQALLLLAEGVHPDVVILDMNMPGLGGAGTLPRLRAIHPELPVLLATGRADHNAMGLVAGHAKVTLLSKPFTTEDLRAYLDALPRRGV